MDKNKIYEDFPRLKEKIETITRGTLLERLDCQKPRLQE